MFSRCGTCHHRIPRVAGLGGRPLLPGSMPFPVATILVTIWSSFSKVTFAFCPGFTESNVPVFPLTVISALRDTSRSMDFSPEFGLIHDRDPTGLHIDGLDSHVNLDDRCLRSVASKKEDKDKHTHVNC